MSIWLQNIVFIIYTRKKLGYIINNSGIFAEENIMEVPI